MGTWSNHGLQRAAIGYDSAAAMVADYNNGEDRQLLGVAKFNTANGALLAALQQQNWDRVAFFYNGKDYAKHQYNINLAKAYTRCSATPRDIDLRAMQARLSYAGFDPHGIDGIQGASTTSALRSFMASKGFVPEDNPSPAALDALVAAAGV